MIYTNANGQSINFNGNIYRIYKLEGISGSEVIVQMQKAPFQDGKSFIDSVMEPRYITVEGSIVYQDAESLRSAMISVFNPKIGGSIDYKGKHIKCRPYSAPHFISDRMRISKTYQEFILQMLAPNPFWLSSENTELLNATTTNAGDVETPVELLISGPVTNPKIENLTVDAYIEIEHTIEAGENLLISTAFGNKYVRLYSGGEYTNIFNKITSESRFWSLNVGENELEYSYSSGENSTAQVTWNDRFLGV